MTTNAETNSVSTSTIEATVPEAVHFTVGRICEEVGAQLGITFTRPVIATIADVTIKQLDTFTDDLSAFARHAKRSIISSDDVKLLVRRNSKLREHIDLKAAEWEAEAGGGKELKKRGPKKRRLASPSVSDEEEGETAEAEGNKSSTETND